MAARDAPFQVADGLWCQRSDRWQTNSAIVARGGRALVCDPSFTPVEIAAIANLAAVHGAGGVSLLITHADEDHVCGIGAFPEATVVAGPATSRAVADGSAAFSLAAASAEWGLDWVGSPFVSRVVADEALVGDWRVEAIDADGHAPDGTAWLVVEEQLLLPGDYLSAVSPPLAFGSVAGFRMTLERLLGPLEDGRVATVVPGHGPLLSAVEAAAIARSDLAYLEAVADAATAAVASERSPGEAVVATWQAAVLPRAAIDDLAIYDPRTLNARTAVADALAAAGR